MFEPQRRHMAAEHVVRIGGDADLDVLADAVGRRVGLDDVGDHPHRREIGHRVGRGRIAGLDVETGRGVARDDLARRSGCGTISDGIDLAIGDDLVDLVVGLAEDAHRIPRGLAVAFRGLLVGGRLIDVFLRAAAGLQKLPDARQRCGFCSSSTPAAASSVDSACSRSGLSMVNSDVALLDVVADVEEGVDDLAGIWREHLDQHILVEVDRADRLLDDAEGARLGGQDLERVGLLVGHGDGLLRDVDIAGGCRLRRLGGAHFAGVRQKPGAAGNGGHGRNAGRHARMLDAKCHHRAPFVPLRMSALFDRLDRCAMRAA